MLINGGNVMGGYWGRGRDGFGDDGWFHFWGLGSIGAEGFVIRDGCDNINVDGFEVHAT